MCCTLYNANEDYIDSLLISLCVVV